MLLEKYAFLVTFKLPRTFKFPAKLAAVEVNVTTLLVPVTVNVILLLA